MDLQKQLRLFDIKVLKQIIFDDLLHYTFLEFFLDMFNSAPVSSIKSIALSGRNLSFKNRLDKVTAEFIDSPEYFTL